MGLHSCFSNLYWKTLSTRHIFTCPFRVAFFFYYCLFRCLRQALPLDFRMTSIIHTIAIIIPRFIFFYFFFDLLRKIFSIRVCCRCPSYARRRHYGTKLTIFTAELITSIDWAKFNHGSDKIRHTRTTLWKMATEILFHGHLSAGQGMAVSRLYFTSTNGEIEKCFAFGKW